MSSQNSKLVFLLAITALALSPVLFAGFIRLDDYNHLFENPQLRTPSFAGLTALWTKSYFNLYIPITYSVWWALMMVGRLLGEVQQNAWLFHAFNLAVHLTNATLVFLVTQTLIGVGRPKASSKRRAIDDSVALISALLFALHPVQVESVAWVSELKGELAALLGFLGLWWHYRSSKRTLAAIFFVAAMLSKPSAIVFPGIVFLIDRIVLRKSLVNSAIAPALYGVPLLILAIVTKHLQPDLEQDFIPTAAQRLIVAADAISFYTVKVLVPFPLAVDYGRTPQLVLNHTSYIWLLCSAFLSVIGAAVVVKSVLFLPSTAQGRHWESLAYCGWAIFMLSVAPVLGLIPFGFQNISTVANHYLYIAILGIGMIAAGVLVRFRDSTISRHIAAVPLVVYTALSIQHAWLWRSTETLFAHTMKINPRSYVSAFCIGDELMRSGQLDEAIPWLEKSSTLNPNDLNALLTLGMAFTHKGEPGKAFELYNAALARNPSIIGLRARYVASIHNNLGMLHLQFGLRAAAVDHFQKAVDIYPQSLNARLNLGNVALAEQRFADAIREYEAALSLSPGNRGIEQQLESARQRSLHP